MKRYHCGLGSGMYENALGAWCTYEDAAAEIAKLKNEVTTLRAALVLADARINDFVEKTK